MTLELFLSIAVFLAALVGGAWALIKSATRQFEKSLDARFDAQAELLKVATAADEKRFERLELSERDYHNFKVEIHRDFLRREDHVRDFGTIKVMIDNLALNLEARLREMWKEMRDAK